MTRKTIVLSVFSRVPVEGKVKTRLVPALGAETTTRLYSAMIARTLGTACASIVDCVRLYCTPTIEQPFIEKLRQVYQLETRLQRGEELGERMRHALQAGLDEYDYSMVLGCDVPALKVKDINLACKALEQGRDAVLGPAKDGGYYLIGLAKPADYLFTDMSWGTDKVLEETRQRLQENALRWLELPIYTDVDEEGDLFVCEEFEELRRIMQEEKAEMELS